MRLTQTEGGLALAVDLPGLERAEVEVAVCKGVLSVCGGLDESITTRSNGPRESIPVLSAR